MERHGPDRCCIYVELVYLRPVRVVRCIEPDGCHAGHRHACRVSIAAGPDALEVGGVRV